MKVTSQKLLLSRTTRLSATTRSPTPLYCMMLTSHMFANATPTTPHQVCSRHDWQPAVRAQLVECFTVGQRSACCSEGLVCRRSTQAAPRGDARSTQGGSQIFLYTDVNMRSLLMGFTLHFKGRLPKSLTSTPPPSKVRTRRCFWCLMVLRWAQQFS